MKRPPVDLSAMLTGTYLEKVSFVNKFIRYWGTTTVNGVECLMPYKFVYGGWGGGFLGGESTEGRVTTEKEYVCTPVMTTYTDELGNTVTVPATDDNNTPIEACSYQDVTRERQYGNGKYNWDYADYNGPLASSKLLKLIKSFDQFKAQRWKGIREMWLYLDPYKTAVFSALDTADNLNRAQEYNKVEVLRLKPVTKTIQVDIVVNNVLTKISETITVEELVPVWVVKCKLEILPEEVSKIEATSKTKYSMSGKVQNYYTRNSYVSSGFLGLSNFGGVGEDFTALRDELHTKYDDIFDTNLIVSRSNMLLPEDYVPEEGVDGGYKDTGLDMLTRYAFYGDKDKIKVTSAYTGSYISEYIDSESNYSSYTAYPTTVIEFELDVVDYESSSTPVTKLAADFQDKGYIVTETNGDSGFSTSRYEFTNVNKFYTWYTAGNYQRSVAPSSGAFIGYNTPSDELGPNWIISGNRVTKRYHLKLSALKDSNLKLDDKIKLIGELLNTDYKEKDSGGGFLNFIIVVIVVVVAVLAAKFTGGKSLVAAKGVITATVVAVAVVTFAAVIALGAAIAAATGNYAAASQLNGLSKMIAPIVFVAQVILIVDFVSTGYDKMFGGASQSGAETAANQAAGVTDLADDLAINTVGDAVQKAISDLISKYTEISLDNAVKVAEMTVDLYSRNVMESVDRARTETAKLQEEMEKMQQAKEQSKYDDFAKLMINSLMNPLNIDSAEFAYTDTPYERIAGSMHIGNVQATTVLGLYGDSTRTYVRNLV